MRKYLAMSVVCVCVGCATLAPSVTAKDCYQKVAAGEIAVTETMNGLLTAAEGNLVDKEQSDKAEVVLDTSKALLANARDLCPVETRTAFNILAEVRGLVLEVNQILGESQ